MVSLSKWMIRVHGENVFAHHKRLLVYYLYECVEFLPKEKKVQGAKQNVAPKILTFQIFLSIHFMAPENMAARVNQPSSQGTRTACLHVIAK